MIRLRTFYIFKVNSDYSKLTRTIPSNLFSAYLNIKLSTQNNLEYLYNEYFSFTDSIKKKDVSSFIYSKLNRDDGYSLYGNVHMYNNYYTDEVSKLIVKSSFMVLKSNKVNSIFLTVLAHIPNIESSKSLHLLIVSEIDDILSSPYLFLLVNQT